MSEKKWVRIGTTHCEFLDKEVELFEERVYPPEQMPEPVKYQVTARKCNDNINCNMAGYPCSWAFTNPETDRFEIFNKEEK